MVDLQYCFSFWYVIKWFVYMYVCIYVYMSIHIYIYVVFNSFKIFHYGLLHNFEYSSLCYKIGLCCLSILYVIVCICLSQTPNPSLPCFPSSLAIEQVCSLCLWVCFCFADKFIWSYFGFHILVVLYGVCLSLTYFT